MINARVVELAVAYLDECNAERKRATLVGMHWYIDARQKTLPLTEEINAALAQRPNIYVEHLAGATAFTTNRAGRIVTAKDMEVADTQYRREFSGHLRRLKDDSSS